MWQLEEAKRAGEKTKDDSDQKPDIAPEDNAIEMSEDFEANPQDLEPAGLPFSHPQHSNLGTLILTSNHMTFHTTTFRRNKNCYCCVMFVVVGVFLLPARPCMGRSRYCYTWPSKALFLSLLSDFLTN
jgi:hypothetical protein